MLVNDQWILSGICMFRWIKQVFAQSFAATGIHSLKDYFKAS